MKCEYRAMLNKEPLVGFHLTSKLKLRLNVIWEGWEQGISAAGPE